MHECYAMQILETRKTKTAKKNGHEEQKDEAQGPRKLKMIRDIKSHQLLDDVSQTYFYQEVWQRCQHSNVQQGFIQESQSFFQPDP